MRDEVEEDMDGALKDKGTYGFIYFTCRKEGDTLVAPDWAAAQSEWVLHSHGGVFISKVEIH